MYNQKRALLTEGPVGKALIKLTIPMIFGTVSIVAFNLVDAFFVGKLGTNELAALSFTFPVVLVINSLALGLGIGTSAVISRAIGEGDHHKVQRLTTDSLTLSVLLVAFFVTIGFITMDPIFRLLGATNEILSLIKQYMRIWYLGNIFVVVPMVGNNGIRATGDTKTPSIIMFTAASMNTIMDPLLIFGIGPFPKLGLAGAAIATVSTRSITLVVALYVLIHRDRMITFKRCALTNMLNSWKKILYIGIPAAGGRIIIPLTTGFITSILAKYGPAAVAGYGVSSRIEFFAITVIRALSTVISPYVGQNWGAGQINRINLGIRYSNQFSLVWGAVMYLLLALTARPIAAIFNRNPEVISVIILYLCIVPISFGMEGVILVSTSAMNALNKPFHAVTLTIIQMFVLYIPLAFLGARLFGIPGVFGALTIAYCVGGIASRLVINKILIIVRKKAYNNGIISVK